MNRLNTLFESLHGFWAARATRERRILLTGGIASLVLVGWVLVWEPVNSWAADQQQRLARTAETAAVVSHGRERLAAVDDSDERDAGLPVAVAASTRSPMQAARRVAEELDIVDAIERREPTADGGLRIRFSELRFSALVRWVKAMEDHGLAVTRARLNPSDPDRPQGRVRAELDLAPGAT